jgi:DnaK suppressor protein
MGGREMNEQELDSLRAVLFGRRQEILDQVNHLEQGLLDLEERQIEPEDHAQKVDLTIYFDKLDIRERTEIAEIDLSLQKMERGNYGICEVCGQAIPVKRLRALPWTRLCLKDAEDYEKNKRSLPPAKELLTG